MKRTKKEVKRMRKHKFLRHRKFVAVAMAATLMVTSASGYICGGGVSKAAEPEDVTYAAPVVDLDFESSYTSGDYTEDGGTYELQGVGDTATKIVANPDDATDKVLETSGERLWGKSKPLDGKDFSNGISISMRIRAKEQVQSGDVTCDWHYIFSLGAFGNGTKTIDGTIGFITRGLDPNHSVFPGGHWVAGNTVGDDFTYLYTKEANKWHTFTYTYSKDAWSVYVDGVKAVEWSAEAIKNADEADVAAFQANFAALMSGISAAGEMTIGGNIWDQRTPAYYDDVQVYNRSLSAAEVAYITALGDAKKLLSDMYKSNTAKTAIQTAVTSNTVSAGTVSVADLKAKADAINQAIADNKADLELATFAITVTAEDTKKFTYGGTTEGFDAVVYGKDAQFTVTPKKGYSVAVTIDGTAATPDVDGKYTISNVTAAHTVVVTPTAVQYPVNYYIDGAAQTPASNWDMDDLDADGKIPLTALTTGQLGWFLDEDEKAPDKAITGFAPDDYMTDDGITVYGYNPYTITSDAGADSGINAADGTFEKPDESVKHYYKDVIQIKAQPAAGKTLAVTAQDGNSDPIDTKVVLTEDGDQAVQFEMPASNVTITKYEFVGLDKTGLTAAINGAQPICDTNNEPTDANAAKGLDAKYTETTWNAFKTAFEKAKQVSEANDSDNTQAAIDAATEALTEAQDALKFKCLVTFDKTSLNVERGNTATITPTVVTDGTGALTWTSSNEDVATVADASGNGTVTGVALGSGGNNTVTITATAEDGTTATCEATVIVKVTGITLANTDVVLGAKLTLVPTVTPADATELDIEWTSSDSSTVRVDKNGVLKGMSAGGPVTITAEVNGQSATCEVNVISSLASGSNISPKMNVTEEGVYLRFKSTLSADAVNNWDTPRLRVFTDSACTDAGRYTYRADNFIEVPVGKPSVTTVDRGIEWTDDIWTAWQAANKAGMEYYVSARKAGSSLVLTYTAGAISSTATVPVNEEDGPFYVDLDSCLSNLTDLRAVDSIYFSDPGPEKTVTPVNPDSVVTPKPVVTPGPAIDVPVQVGDIKTDKTVSGGNGDDWWASPAYSDNYPMSGKDSATEVYIGVDKLNAAGQGAFCIDIFSDDKYLTVASHNNAWTNGATVSNPSELEGPMDVALEEGHVYKVTVTRKGNDITVKVYDATAQKDMFEITAKDVNLPNDINVRVTANLGTLDVGQQVDVDPSSTAKPDESAAPSQKPEETAGPAESAAPTAAPSAEPSKEPEPSAEPTKGPEETTAPTTEPEPTAEPEDKGAEVGDKVTVSGTKYEVTAGSQVAYKAEKKAKASVTIPATVKVNGKTYKVTSVEANAFKNNKKVKNITVGKNITKIGKNAFKGCKKLKKIVIKSKKLKASGISKAAFKGVTKKTTVIVPKGKVKAYKKMFRKKGLAKNVKVKAAK